MEKALSLFDSLKYLEFCENNKKNKNVCKKFFFQWRSDKDTGDSFCRKIQTLIDDEIILTETTDLGKDPISDLSGIVKEIAYFTGEKIDIEINFDMEIQRKKNLILKVFYAEKLIHAYKEYFDQYPTEISLKIVAHFAEMILNTEEAKDYMLEDSRSKIKEFYETNIRNPETYYFKTKGFLDMFGDKYFHF